MSVETAGGALGLPFAPRRGAGAASTTAVFSPPAGRAAAAPPIRVDCVGIRAPGPLDGRQGRPGGPQRPCAAAERGAPSPRAQMKKTKGQGPLHGNPDELIVNIRNSKASAGSAKG